MRNFVFNHLGEVRMLGALRKHTCIVEIYGHQLSSKWVPATEGKKEQRRLQSAIMMEFIKGGSLKVYLLLEYLDMFLCHYLYCNFLIFLEVDFCVTELHGQISKEWHEACSS